MAESKEAWERVGQEFSDLGRQVKQHYEGQERAGQEAPADKRKVDEALRQLADSLDQAFTALGDAIRDPQFGEQTKKAAGSLSDAMAATFAELSERFRSRREGPPGS
jgi:formiminotetrahydrofolate cyclodeaminase